MVVISVRATCFFIKGKSVKNWLPGFPTLMTNIEGEWQQQYWEEQFDWWLRLQQLLSASRSASVSTAGPAEVLQEKLNNNNLRISSNSRIHRWHWPHGQQDNSFAPLASYNKFFWIQGAQHPEWASPRCNCATTKWITTVQHKEFNIDIEKNNDKCTTLFTATSSIKRCETTNSIKRYGFNIFIYNIEMDDENNNHLRRVQQRTICPTIPLTSSDWGWGHQQQERNWERSDCQPSMGRIRQQLGEQEPGCDTTTWPQRNGGHHQHRDCQWVARAHLRFATPLTSWSATRSTQLRHASTTTSSSTLRLWTSTSSSTTPSDWECCSTRGMRRYTVVSTVGT